MSQPIRVQRRRVKGYRHPENTRYVGRGTKWGNPFTVALDSVKKEMWMLDWRATVDECLAEYEKWVDMHLKYNPTFLEPLRGKNLSCFCKLSDPCHVNVIFKKLYP